MSTHLCSSVDQRMVKIVEYFPGDFEWYFHLKCITLIWMYSINGVFIQNRPFAACICVLAEVSPQTHMIKRGRLSGYTIQEKFAYLDTYVKLKVMQPWWQRPFNSNQLWHSSASFWLILHKPTLKLKTKHNGWSYVICTGSLIQLWDISCVLMQSLSFLSKFFFFFLARYELDQFGIIWIGFDWIVIKLYVRSTLRLH